MSVPPLSFIHPSILPFFASSASLPVICQPEWTMDDDQQSGSGAESPLVLPEHLQISD
jgi:hypothetical protein